MDLWLIILIVAVVLIVFYVIGVYNSLVTLKIK